MKRGQERSWLLPLRPIISMILLLLLLGPRGVLSIEMRAVVVPRYRVSGARATLRCDYDLGQDRLYSVKWYFNGSEFYRYVPKDRPPSQVFSVPAIRVDQVASDDRVVVVRDVGLDASGDYVCEASSEAPRFKTVHGQGHMRVVDLPDSKPILEGAKVAGYRVGETLNVSCRSPNAMPAATLKWYINNEMVDPRQLTRSPPERDALSGLYTSKLGLTLRLRRRHFVQSHVSIKCTATIYTEYFESSELHIPGINLGEKALESRGRAGLNHAHRLMVAANLVLWLLCMLV